MLHHVLQLIDDTGLNVHAGLIRGYRHVEDGREYLSPNVGDRASAIYVLWHDRLASTRISTSLRIALDQCHVSLRVKPQVLGAKSPTSHCVVVHRITKPTIEQQASSVVRLPADEADVLFQ